MNTVTEEMPTKQTRLNVGFEAHQGSKRQDRGVEAFDRE